LRSLAALGCFLALTLGTGFLGSRITAGSLDTWYRSLAKPPFNPPDWLFAPVWTALFVAMAVAAWRIWRKPPDLCRRIGLVLFAVQLALNLAWSATFFGLRSPLSALVVVVLLQASVAATTWVFAWRDRIAALLFLPYLAWVAFAMLLNAAIVFLN